MKGHKLQVTGWAVCGLQFVDYSFMGVLIPQSAKNLWIKSEKEAPGTQSQEPNKV